jgi:hypothetical protein
MVNNHVLVKYYDRRMLLTVDISALLSTLFDAYGDDVIIEFMAMDETERRESTDESEAVPIVRDRFQVFEMQKAAEARRRPDIEQAAIAAGVK